MLLTHLSHATDAVDYLTHDLKGKEIGTFERHISIVGYYRSDQSDLFFTLKKEYGEMLDAQLSERLRKSVPIPARYLILKGPKSFCDSCPPIPHMLRLLWGNIFPDLAAKIPRDKNKGYTPIPVTVAPLTETLQKYYGYPADGTGNRGIPRSEWVGSALETFVSLRMARRADSPGSYVIRFKAFHGDLLERFGHLCHEQQERKSQKSKSRQTRFEFDTPR